MNNIKSMTSNKFIQYLLKEGIEKFLFIFKQEEWDLERCWKIDEKGKHKVSEYYKIDFRTILPLNTISNVEEGYLKHSFYHLDLFSLIKKDVVKVYKLENFE